MTTQSRPHRERRQHQEDETSTATLTAAKRPGHTTQNGISSFRLSGRQALLKLRAALET
jgi:hypothetical protein